MSQRWQKSILSLALALALAACSGTTTPLSEKRASEIAWEALKPSTASRNLANWEITEARRVAGREVGAEFDGQPAPGCFGPTPPTNEEVQANESYWLVRLSPREATPRPGAPSGPTAPPAIPEPNVRGAAFLIRAKDGQIVARKVHCIIY